MPAKAGTQSHMHSARGPWTPAFAGATNAESQEASVRFVPLMG
jgi:hypothetical protein